MTEDRTGNQKDSNSQDGTLMSAALYNLKIAQQYIDATSHLPEHRLVCFHYAVALLATDRKDGMKLALARQYFEAASSWEAAQDEKGEIRESIERIVCESHYNLGVIDELEENYSAAQKSYGIAVDIARRNSGKFDNVAVLAGLGSISSNKTIIQQQWRKTKSLKDASEDAIKEHTELVTRLAEAIQNVRKEIDDLTERIEVLGKIAPKSWQRPITTNEPQRRSGGLFRQLFGDATDEAIPVQRDSEEVGPSGAESHGILRRHEILSQIQAKLDDFKRDLEVLQPSRKQ